MSTIAAGQVAGMSRPAALEFSFFLSMPTMVVATCYDLFKTLKHNRDTVSEGGIAPLAMNAHEWIVLAIGFFRVAHGDSAYILHAGGWCGIVTAATAWYASAAGVVNGMSARRVLPVGSPLFGELPSVARVEPAIHGGSGARP